MSSIRNCCLALIVLGAWACAQTAPARPARPGDKPLPCDSLSVMRRAHEFSAPSGVPIMADRYYSLELAVSGEARTHMPLVALDQGRLLPAGCGDTPGIFYVIPKLMTVFDLSLSRGFVAFLVWWVSVCGLVGIAGFFALFGNSPMAYVATVVELFLAERAFRTGDLYFVAPCVVIALVPWALLVRERCSSARWLPIFALFAGTLLGFANFLRDQAGTGMLLFAAVLLATSSLASRRTRMISLGALFIGVIVPAAFGHILLDRRDAYLRQVQPGYSAGVRSHVLWHTVYVGFGFLRNEIIPDYRDEVAVDKVRSEAPNVVYLSAEYDSYLRRAVLALVRQHPVFVATTIFAKLGVLAMYFLAAANAGALATIGRPKPLAIEVAFGVALAFEALPGIVAVPCLPYLLGYIATAALYGVVSFEYWLRRHESRGQWDVQAIPVPRETEAICA